ncbi:MAG: hypothetical protein H6827_09840 [Planctomycetes bacterium]|nr:hypothetical protein [Planctomycetota bacterium]
MNQTQTEKPVTAPKGGRTAATEIEANPSKYLAAVIQDQRKAVERVADVAVKALGEVEGTKLKELLSEGSLKPRVERLAKRLNALSDTDFDLVEGLIEGQIQMVIKAKRS